MSNTNTDALTSYMLDFYNDPKNVEDYKINFIKNHYFPTINAILKCSFDEFKTGMSRHNNIIWFCNNNNPDYHVIYDFKNKLYYIKDKDLKPYLVNIEDYIINNKKRKNDNKEEVNKKFNLYNICSIGCNII